MVTKLSRRLFLGYAGATAVAYPAFAHRLARTETEVRIDADGRVDVIHVYHLQDAQSALYQSGVLDAPDLTPLRARAKLALYTNDHFAIASGGVPISLEIIGAEIEGDSVYVYQQGQLGEGALSIDARMLRPLLKQQINSVNIVRDGRTVTLDFIGDDGVKAVALG